MKDYGWGGKAGWVPEGMTDDEVLSFMRESDPNKLDVLALNAAEIALEQLQGTIDFLKRSLIKQYDAAHNSR